MRIDAGIALTKTEGVAGSQRVVLASSQIKTTTATTAEQTLFSFPMTEPNGLYSLLVFGSANGGGQKTIRIKQGSTNGVANSFTNANWRIEYFFIARNNEIYAVNLFNSVFQSANATYTKFATNQSFLLSGSKALATDSLQVDHFTLMFTNTV